MQAAKSDMYVILVILGIFIVWLLVLLKRWIVSSGKPKLPIGIMESEVIVGEAVDVLKEAGYKIVSARHRVPIYIDLDGKELESRLYIDYFAMSEEEVFIVKLAKERQPLELTGSAIRDRLLAYQLLYEDAAGVLYVNLKEKTVHKIKFQINV